MRRVVAGALVAALVLLAAALRPRGTSARPGDGAPPVPEPVGAHDDGAADGMAARGPRGPVHHNEKSRKPRSLRGTRVDGGLVVAADGRFVPTIDARRLFDYFLSATGEMPDDALRARIVAEIERRLPPDAAREAIALLDRYLAYRERVRVLAASAPADGDLDGRFALSKRPSRDVGDDAAAAFFAEEEAHARRVLEIRRITADGSLSVEERAARVEALYATAEADLPAETREARAAGRLAIALREAEAEIRANGGGTPEIQALRERLAGPEVAARLADLDARRAEWLRRVDALRTERDRIAADPTLDEAARTEATARLLDGFTTSERRRIEALDRLAAEAEANATR
jgi:lipase chaperone LimK